MTSAALAQAPNIRPSTATIDVVCAASSVATKITAAAATVIRLSALSGRFVDVAVVMAAHTTTIAASRSAGFARILHSVQNAATASSAIASARNANSFGRLKTS